MRNDRLQGILFDKSELVDLVQRNPRERLLRAFMAKKARLQEWVKLERTNTAPSPYVVIRGSRNREAQMSELANRFRDRS